MRYTIILAMAGQIASVAAVSHGGMIRYRIDLEVTKAFAGLAIGDTGALYVEHADDLIDQKTSGVFHQHIGWYGHPDGPTPVEMLWDFGDNTAAQSQTGFITINANPLLSEFNYSLTALTGGSDTIVKGAFAPLTHSPSNNMFMRDFDKTALSGDDLVAPVFADYDTLNGALAFVGNSTFVGYKATGITPISDADFAAQLIAGSPASLLQPISTSVSPFDISFDYQFDVGAVGSGATLQVLLDGNLLQTINASAAGILQTTTFQVSQASLLGQSALNLEFRFDGSAGSTLLLDNLDVTGSDLLNGDFQTQSLAAWGTGGPGAVSVAAVTSSSSSTAVVPEPSSLTMMLTLIGLAAGVRRRKRSFLWRSPSSDDQ
ncbi:hypothetical protein Mal4_08040 [Maioricimonas rarisocia]|uniref:Ice-binding protein C-terminal domain-containing protein n=1 Tax=Maioricimonas rarisocia TaxID=2528026 RepID=A0A517Z235_9PLAN|nr:PEP-CTERM sorting domain-containing protein [Maioricimonas rarisocia]QDU36518.1 hypothetical protein Mal4_08040 [Maioricimonas rarisocia]